MREYFILYPLFMSEKFVHEAEKMQTKKVTTEERLFGAVAYLGILFLIPLLLKKGNPFARFHGKQGLVLFLGWVMLWIVNVVPILGQLVWMIGSIVLLVASIAGIIHAWRGEQWELPILGSYAKKINL